MDAGAGAGVVGEVENGFARIHTDYTDEVKNHFSQNRREVGRPAEWSSTRVGGRFLVTVFFLGIGVMIAAPLLRRYNLASPVLAGGALVVLVVAVAGLLFVDPKIGQAAIESNRRQYFFIAACELPVLILALISWKRFRWAFWVGWGINLALSVFVVVIIVWLEFFWHW